MTSRQRRTVPGIRNAARAPEVPVGDARDREQTACRYCDSRVQICLISRTSEMRRPEQSICLIMRAGDAVAGIPTVPARGVLVDTGRPERRDRATTSRAGT